MSFAASATAALIRMAVTYSRQMESSFIPGFGAENHFILIDTRCIRGILLALVDQDTATSCLLNKTQMHLIHDSSERGACTAKPRKKAFIQASLEHIGTTFILKPLYRE